MYSFQIDFKLFFRFINISILFQFSPRNQLTNALLDAQEIMKEKIQNNEIFMTLMNIIHPHSLPLLLEKKWSILHFRKPKYIHTY